MYGLAGWASDFKCSDERGPLLFSSVVDLQGRLSRHGRIPGPHYGRPGIGGNMFSTGFRVYRRDDNEVSCRSVWLLRRPLPGMDRVVNVHLEGDPHFRPIEDLRMYAKCYKCIHCGSQWSAPFRLERHQANCQWANRYRYKGGPYRSKLRFYELLAPLGVVMAPEHQYYPYSATFDLEACLVPVSEGTFTSRQVPMSGSLASNVPGYI